jgi:hypothetical protein
MADDNGLPKVTGWQEIAETARYLAAEPPERLRSDIRRHPKPPRGLDWFEHGVMAPNSLSMLEVDRAFLRELRLGRWELLVMMGRIARS